MLLVQVLFQLLSVVDNDLSLRDLEVSRLSSTSQRVRFDLEVHGFEHEEGLDLMWVYNRDLFDAWRIEQMARHFNRVLNAVAAHPEEPLEALSLLSSEERSVLLDGFNATLEPFVHARIRSGRRDPCNMVRVVLQI